MKYRILALLLLATLAHGQTTYYITLTNGIVVGSTTVTNVFEAGSIAVTAGDTTITNIVQFINPTSTVYQSARIRWNLSPASSAVVGSTNNPLLYIRTGFGYQAWYELAYNDTTAQYAPWTVAPSLTSGYDPTLATTCRVTWAGAVTGAVVWSIQIASRTSGGLWSNTYEAARLWTSSAGGVAVGQTIDADIAISDMTTNEITPGRPVQLLIGRVTGNAGDTMAGDARLLNAAVWQ